MFSFIMYNIIRYFKIKMNKRESMPKKYWNEIGLLLGVIGLIMFMFAIPEKNIDNKNLLIIYSGIFLFISPLMQKETFFIGLNGIALVIAIMIFFPIPTIINILILSFLTIVFAIYYFKKYIVNTANICAFIGLVALCLGILFINNFFMLVSGIFLSIYSIFSIKDGFSVGWVFLILNIVFVIVAADTLY